MSLILDALRKSEAARRRSEAPDLFSPTPQAHVPVRSRPAWPLWAMAGFGLVSSAIATWMLLHRPAPEAPAARPVAPVVADAPASPPAPASAPTTTTLPATLPVIPTAPPPAVSATPAAAPAVAPSPASAPAAAPTLPPVTTAPAPAPLSAPPPAPPSPKPAPVPPTGDRATALADLDADVRRQLPPLKLSMHLWNDDPQRRFVILDGQRLREGDTLGELVVERIDRDDVVLSWRGARLRLPAE